MTYEMIQLEAEIKIYLDRSLMYLLQNVIVFDIFSFILLAFPTVHKLL